jgi:hypothetical protein
VELHGVLGAGQLSGDLLEAQPMNDAYVGYLVTGGRRPNFTWDAPRD